MASKEEIITDAQIHEAWQNANFGDRSKREVLLDTIIKTAQGYITGRTAICIASELGLIKQHGKGNPHSLTDLGLEYLLAPSKSIKETDQEALREGYDVRDPKKWPPEKDGSYWCMIESSGHLIALGKRLVRVKYVKEEGGFVSEDGGFKIIYYLTIE